MLYLLVMHCMLLSHNQPPPHPPPPFPFPMTENSTAGASMSPPWNLLVLIWAPATELVAPSTEENTPFCRCSFICFASVFLTRCFISARLLKAAPPSCLSRSRLSASNFSLHARLLIFCVSVRSQTERSHTRKTYAVMIGSLELLACSLTRPLWFHLHRGPKLQPPVMIQISFQQLYLKILCSVFFALVVHINILSRVFQIFSRHTRLPVVSASLWAHSVRIQ